MFCIFVRWKSFKDEIMKPSFLYDFCSSCKSIHVTNLGESIIFFKMFKVALRFIFKFCSYTKTVEGAKPFNFFELLKIDERIFINALFPNSLMETVQG
jgi:hypothetical protein